MKKSSINDIEINQHSNGVYIVLEAGPTHNGIDSAKGLAKAARDAGANAIKFQMLNADRLMADKSILFSYSYLEKNEDGSEQFIPFEEPLFDILKRRELTKEEWKELKVFCDQIEITMFTTATYPDEVDFVVDELGLDSIKINSSDVNELEFIRYCAQKKVNIQLDTGNADVFEIERAVITAEEAGCENIVIHHCPSGYPAKLESIHLRMIPTLKKLFPDYAIAFSDHSPGWEMDIAAIALGADMIEKTITMDRTTKSCEHSFSIEPDDCQRLVRSVRELETALGRSRRVIPTAIKEKRKAVRRSPYAIRDLSKDTTISWDQFDFKRPGFGLTSSEFGFFVGKKLVRDLKKGEPISYDHI